MHLLVKNFRGAERAEAEWDGILGVFGKNEAGKSSVCQAVAAALSGHDLPFLTPADDGKPKSRFTKSQAGALVRGGMDAGSATITNGDSSVAISWPKCERQSTGKSPPQSSVYATGLINPLDMSDKARANFFTSLLQIAPTLEDLKQELQEHFNDDEICRLWSGIDTNGWDSAHKTLKEHNAKQKGQWEAVANTPYGATKADSWFPADGWDEILASSSLDSLNQVIGVANGKLEAAIASTAVTGAKIAEWKAKANADLGEDPGPSLRKAENKLAEVDAQIAAIPKPGEKEKTTPCPHCEKPLVVIGALVRKPAPAGDKHDIEVNKSKRVVLDKEKTELQTLISDLSRKKRTYDNDLHEQQQAQQALQDTPESTGSQGQVDAAREALRVATLRRDAFDAHSKAHRLHGSIKRNQIAVDVLSAEGLRQKKLIRALSAFNKRLAELSAIADWPTVEVDDNLDIRYGNRHHMLCADSAKYRIKCTLQVAVAEIDGSNVVIFDGADILDTKGRNGLTSLTRAWIGGSGGCAIFGMTHNSKVGIPDFGQIGIGKTIWLESGLMAAA